MIQRNAMIASGLNYGLNCSKLSRNDFLINSWYDILETRLDVLFFYEGLQASLVLFPLLTTLEISAQTEILVLLKVCLIRECQKSFC